MQHDHDQRESPSGFWGSRYAIGLLVIGAVAAYFLLTEHLAHVAGALPFLLILACPLMHMFMHGGHGHRHGDDPPQDSSRKSDRDSTGGAA